MITLAWLTYIVCIGNQIRFGMLYAFYDTVCRSRGINFFALCMDNNAGKLVSHEVHEFCASHGIQLIPVPAYRHERFFDTLYCMIRSMIETSHLPGFIWNYAA